MLHPDLGDPPSWRVTTPIAYATAHTAALFVKHLPPRLWGVHPPETLPAELRRAVLAGLKQRGLQVSLRLRRLRKAEEDEEGL